MASITAKQALAKTSHCASARVYSFQDSRWKRTGALNVCDGSNFSRIGAEAAMLAGSGQASRPWPWVDALKSSSASVCG